MAGIRCRPVHGDRHYPSRPVHGGGADSRLIRYTGYVAPLSSLGNGGGFGEVMVSAAAGGRLAAFFIRAGGATAHDA